MALDQELGHDLVHALHLSVSSWLPVEPVTRATVLSIGCPRPDLSERAPLVPGGELPTGVT